MEKNIIFKQKKALENVRSFIKKTDLKNPNLTGPIWKLLNDANIQTNINKEESLELKDNWSRDLIGLLQRELINYQLYQMKLDNPPKLFNIIKSVFNKIDSNKDQKYSILDIGCTSGYYYEIINFYNPNKFSYQGCDYNKGSVELAKQYYPNVNFFVDDLTNLSISDNMYDITFLSGVIEHIPLYIKGLNELCRITKKYIILHRIWLSNGKTTSTKGTQYFVPVIRNHYNKEEFFSILKSKSFTPIWESEIYDGNCKTYLLKRVLQ